MVESEQNPIQTERISNKTLLVRFTRPNARNPLSVGVLKLLNRIIDTNSKGSTFDKIIFTGTDDVFASGANLREIAEVTGETAREFALRGQNLMNKIASSDKITCLLYTSPSPRD